MANANAHSSTSKILVVDDEKLIRLAICAKLKKVGYVPVAVGSVGEAVAVLKESPRGFSTVISDIMMDDMDGFVFRDIVRGIAPSMPMFFLTALDPEEGGGFLKRIFEDPLSYYLPKAVDTGLLLKRVQQVVASHRVEQFIQNKIDDDRMSLELAAHIQRSLLPVRAMMTPRGFYTTYWHPVDMVSGDLFEAIPFGAGCFLYVLGDVQGHGTSAALAMTAVQSFLKNLVRREGAQLMGPHEIANLMQAFFRTNLAEVSYMTALICIHRPVVGNVQWLSCGAPDLIVVEDGADVKANPERRGGLPIGLFPDTVYTKDDVVVTPLSQRAVCIGYTDGLMDLSCDSGGEERLSLAVSHDIRCEIAKSLRQSGGAVAAPQMFMKAIGEFGFDRCHDDVTLLAFGSTCPIPGVCELTIRLSPFDIDRASQDVAAWCRSEGWPQDGIVRVQLVLEEKLMNVHDHGFDDRDRLRAVVSLRLKRVRDNAVLTVWDDGSEEPSVAVAAGDATTAFEMANRSMSGHGRGRLVVRELCDGIERKRYEALNETTYHIPLSGRDQAPAAKEKR